MKKTRLTIKEVLQELELNKESFMDYYESGFLLAEEDSRPNICVVGSDGFYELYLTRKELLEQYESVEMAKAISPRKLAELSPKERFTVFSGLVVNEEPHVTAGEIFLRRISRELVERGKLPHLIFYNEDVQYFKRQHDQGQAVQEKQIIHKNKNHTESDKKLLAYAERKRKTFPSYSIPDIARQALKNQEDFLFKPNSRELPKQETVEKRLRKLYKEKSARQ